MMGIRRAAIQTSEMNRLPWEQRENLNGAAECLDYVLTPLHGVLYETACGSVALRKRRPFQ